MKCSQAIRRVEKVQTLCERPYISDLTLRSDTNCCVTGFVHCGLVLEMDFKPIRTRDAMRVHETIGCMGAGVCLRACSLTNPACNAQPYCHLQPLWLHHIFRHYLSHKRHNFPRKKVIEHEIGILIFLTTFIWNTSHSKKNSVGYCHKREKSSCKILCYSSRIFMKLEFSRQIFEKLKYQVSPKSVQWGPSRLTDRQTDGHDEANSRFSQFCERT